jgi:hypothetical protein
MIKKKELKPRVLFYYSPAVPQHAKKTTLMLFRSIEIAASLTIIELKQGKEKGARVTTIPLSQGM